MSGVRTRQVYCRDETQKIVDDSNCEGEKLATLDEGCNPQPCTQNNWMSTVWGPCVDGQRRRTAHCHLADGSNGADSDCEMFPKPGLSKACVPFTCDTAGEPPSTLPTPNPVNPVNPDGGSGGSDGTTDGDNVSGASILSVSATVLLATVASLLLAL